AAAGVGAGFTGRRKTRPSEAPGDPALRPQYQHDHLLVAAAVYRTMGTLLTTVVAVQGEALLERHRFDHAHRTLGHRVGEASLALVHADRGAGVALHVAVLLRAASGDDLEHAVLVQIPDRRLVHAATRPLRRQHRGARLAQQRVALRLVRVVRHLTLPSRCYDAVRRGCRVQPFDPGAVRIAAGEQPRRQP